MIQFKAVAKKFGKQGESMMKLMSSRKNMDGA